ncbi:hypothetical protein HDU93_008177 [Gonapodya sp. JEL0774]|nr:hypothetical protein HDU93_008177 [Gonapodya sp. JEL0774]
MASESADVNVVSQATLADAEMEVKPADDSDPEESLQLKDHDGVADEADKAPTTLQYTPLSFSLLFVGLAVFLGALDQTILAVAIRKCHLYQSSIVTDFQTFSGLSWIFTSYLLTATAFIPTYGKAADVFGRKAVILVAIIVFEVGSAICGVATSMTMLIVGRAVAGLGGGGIFSIVIVIISYVSFAEVDSGLKMILKSSHSSYVKKRHHTVGETSSVPGGHRGYINLPLGVITILTVIFLLRLPVGSGDISKQLRRMDVSGTFLLVLGIVLVLVPLAEGGNEYPWNSGFVIGLLIAGFVVLGLFVYVEARVAVEPVIPLSLFKNRYVAIVFLCSFFNGMAFFSLLSYTPTYFQVVNGDTPTQAGIDSLPLILSLVVFSILSGVIMSSTGYYQPLLMIGASMEIVGGALMYTLNQNSRTDQKVGYLIMTGGGLGLSVQTLIIAAQVAAPPEQLSLVTANVNFWQQIGAVLGIAITSSVFSNKLTTSLMELAPNAVVAYVKNNPSNLRNSPPSLIPPEELEGVISAYVAGLDLLFLLTVPFAGMYFISSLFVKKSKLPKGIEMAVAG